MPNWCHDKLTVEGAPTELAAFVHKVVITDGQDKTPLTFNAHVPEPSAEAYAAMEEAAKVTCSYCGGKGKRPVNAAEAWAQGVTTDDWKFMADVADLPLAERPDCNVCAGTGRRVLEPAWYDWRIAHWGCKWDSNFEGASVAIVTAKTEFAADLAQMGRVDLSEVGMVIYRFTTPWGPPRAWLATTAALENKLKFTLEYAEPGAEFAGRTIWNQGVLAEDSDLAVSDVLTDEEMWF
jgi:hypothetical protein